jgi:LmbE family N-acetylglucosaminyl deacetylase
MRFTRQSGEVYVPDGIAIPEALARTTHLGIGAHQDDLEIMALDGILSAFGRSDRWFTGVVVTDGSGSARDSIYADFSNEQMMAVRRLEQKKAAFVGEYAAAILLDHPSSAVKDPSATDPTRDILEILRATRPEIVYLHNLADKHPTHIGVAMHCIRALRSLPRQDRPSKVYGCEVWRDLDWMLDEDKVVFATGAHPNISAALIEVFDSQIIGGKRYDLAGVGRRRANATYFQSHSVDAAEQISFAMDLTPLVQDDSLSVTAYVMSYVDRFAASVRENLDRFEASQEK